MSESHQVYRKFLSSMGLDSNGLSKAYGEGSRGGKILGHTRSGKPIYAKHVDRKAVAPQYSAQDHHDAYDWHDQMQSLHSSAAEKALDATDSSYISPTLKTHLLARHNHLRSLAQRHGKISEWHYDHYKKKADDEDKEQENAWNEMERRHAQAG